MLSTQMVLFMRKKLCEHLRELRGASSQSEFAAKLGTKQTTYSSWERGIKEPDLDTICNISTQFGVSTDWLLGLSERGGSAATATANGAHSIAVAGTGAKVTAGGDCSNCKLLAEHLREITGRS